MGEGGRARTGAHQPAILLLALDLVRVRVMVRARARNQARFRVKARFRVRA